MDAEITPAACSLAALADDLLCVLVPESRVLLMSRTCKRMRQTLERGRCGVDVRVLRGVSYDSRLGGLVPPGVNELQWSFRIRRFEYAHSLHSIQLQFCDFEELTFTHLRVLKMHSNQLAELQLLSLLYMLSLSSELRAFEFTEQSLKSRHIAPLAEVVGAFPRLEVLNLRNNYFVFDALGLVLDAVQTSSLATLDLSSNSCEDGGKTLKLCRVLHLNCGALTSLSLAGMRLRTPEFDALVDALGACRRLQALNLAKNNLHYGCLMQVLKATAQCPLQSFDWSGNRLGSAGTFVLASHILDSTAWHAHLRELKLRMCDVYHGLHHVSHALIACTALRTLDISSNSVYAHEVVKLMASSSLTSLDIGYNYISDHGMQLVLQAALEAPALRHLEILGNHMSRHTIRQFRRMRAKTRISTSLPRNPCECNKCAYRRIA
jgi:hypothetical protein